MALRDPEHLTSCGAPADEYEPEAKALARVLASGPLRGRDVEAVFKQFFGGHCCLGRLGCERLAQELNTLYLGGTQALN